MTVISTDIPRLPRPADRTPIHEPMTPVERRELSKAFHNTSRIALHLDAIVEALEAMPEQWADEVNGATPGGFLKDFTKADVEALRALSDRLDKELEDTE